MTKDANELIFSDKFIPSEIVSFTLIGMAIGGWIVTLLTVGICLCMNTSKYALPPLQYRRIPETKSTVNTPAEVIVDPQPQETPTPAIESKPKGSQRKSIVKSAPSRPPV